jgi:hypothetical protein
MRWIERSLDRNPGALETISPTSKRTHKRNIPSKHPAIEMQSIFTTPQGLRRAPAARLGKTARWS